MPVLSYYTSYYSDLAETMTTYYILSFIIGIGVSCIFGAITKTINGNKGYDGGFAWGFWLGVIGIIVVSCRQPAQYIPTESIIKPAPTTNNGVPPVGGWKCLCGRAHPQYVSTCPCGKNRSEVIRAIATNVSQKVNSKEEEEFNKEKESINTLREYKELLDQGILTQEEFDQKKKEILSK